MSIRETKTMEALKNIDNEDELALSGALKCILLNQLEIMKRLEISSSVTITGYPKGDENEIVIGGDFKKPCVTCGGEGAVPEQTSGGFSLKKCPDCNNDFHKNINLNEE